MAPIKDEHKDLALVPESVLKRRHDLDDLRRKKAAQEEKQSSKRKGTYVRKPATFLAKAKQRRHEQIHDEQTQVIQYKSNSVGSPYVFVIRIREDAGHPPRCVRNILTQLRLKEPNTGVFVRYTDITKRHLHLVEPWIVYGKPSDGLVGDLMERKSFGTVRGEKVPLSDNTIIENALGNEHGMICMEDLVHELTTVGKSFEAVANFLRPFPLSATRSRFEKNLLLLKQGKDYGDQGDEIDEYIKQML
eukprot:jgi/Psemu1/253837/estExt_Genewise1Plus.C_790084